MRRTRFAGAEVGAVQVVGVRGGGRLERRHPVAEREEVHGGDEPLVVRMADVVLIQPDELTRLRNTAAGGASRRRPR